MSHKEHHPHSNWRVGMTIFVFQEFSKTSLQVLIFLTVYKCLKFKLSMIVPYLLRTTPLWVTMVPSTGKLVNYDLWLKFFKIFHLVRVVVSCWAERLNGNPWIVVKQRILQHLSHMVFFLLIQHLSICFCIYMLIFLYFLSYT